LGIKDLPGTRAGKTELKGPDTLTVDYGLNQIRPLIAKKIKRPTRGINNAKKKKKVAKGGIWSHIPLGEGKFLSLREPRPGTGGVQRAKTKFQGPNQSDIASQSSKETEVESMVLKDHVCHSGGGGEKGAGHIGWKRRSVEKIGDSIWRMRNYQRVSPRDFRIREGSDWGVRRRGLGSRDSEKKFTVP